jgi:DNA polymerase-3 subunit alpha
VTAFIHLRNHTAYSLSEGAIKTKDLAKLAAKHGMPAVGITDTNNMFGALEFALAAADAGVQPVMGLQLDVDLPAGVYSKGGAAAVVLFAQNDAGFRTMQELCSRAFIDSEHETRVPFTLLQECSDNLICLTGGPQGWLGKQIIDGHVDSAEECLRLLAKTFPNRLYIELQRHESEGAWPPEAATEATFLKWADKYNLPLVATNDCMFSTPDMFEAHDALLCIAAGRYVMETDRRHMTADHCFKKPAEMAELFADVPEALANTVVIAQRCAFMPKFTKPMLPPFPGLPEGVTAEQEMRRLAREGLAQRLKNLPSDIDEKAYIDRLEFECGVIEKMGFAGYFLIVSDFIKWAKANRIPVGPGRGSGAGSVVSWALSITDLNPLQFKLLFERMLNPERVSMPDFDIDFCQDRRDEVIQYVADRYGRDRVAQIITFGALKPRAALRDVGRVLQIPYPVVDRICKLVPNNPNNPVGLAEAIAGEPLLQQARDSDAQIARMMTIAMKLEGLYRHASTHAAGVVIAHQPLVKLTPMYRDPTTGFLVTQYNMKMVETAGLVKFDFLGLKTLDVLQIATDMLAARGVTVDIDHLPLDDKKTYELLCAADTTAVFQLESSGMRDILRKLQPTVFEEIIALVAMYRPGPMDNIPRFLATKKGEEAPDYIHPLLEPVLKETFGIPVYQEQVMQMAQVLAGYTLGGADLLRRAMGKKIKSEMDAQRAVFIEGCKKANGLDEQFASMVFDLIEKFAGYGFNKSHAAAYALIAYQTAYLKANYPLEFLSASMTYDMGDTDKLAVFREELRVRGTPLLPPDINASDATFKAESEGIRYALAALKGVGRAAMESLMDERAKRGPFTSIQNFLERCDSKVVNKKQLESLISAGAFDTLNPNRAELFENVEAMTRYASSLNDERASGQQSLLTDTPSQALKLKSVTPWDDLTKLQNEQKAIGFYLTAHPLDSYTALLERVQVVPSHTIAQQNASKMVKLAGIPVAFKERTAKTGSKYAFATLTDAHGPFEVMIFSEVLNSARDMLQGKAPLVCKVSIQTRNDETRLVLQHVETVDALLQREGQGVRVHITQPQTAAALHAMLSAVPKGKSRIQVAVAVSTELDALLELPGAYALGAHDRHKLQTLPGVVGVSEI